MAEYLRPDVYVEEISTGEKPISATSTSIGAFVGITARGPVGKPVFITSWSDFVKKFAEGLSTPFMRTSDLALAVYGFFKNGGSSCYVVRVPSSDMAKAQLDNEALTITAKDEGEWGNKLKVKIEAQPKASNLFKVTVELDGTVVEVFENVSNDAESDNFFGEVINPISKYIEIGVDEELEVISLTAFQDGAYSVASVSDSDFIGDKGLNALDVAEDVSMVAVPGKTSDAIVKAVLDYATNRGDCFGIVDAPLSYDFDAEAITTFREKLSGNGAMYYPWGKVVDPLSKNGSLRACPPSGHVMGIFSRTDKDRGVHKAPAGEEAVVRGFVELCVKLTPNHVDLLNPKGINCIVAKPNKGIIVWGARSVNPDPAKRYVSDVRYDLMIKKSLYEGTQWAIFEPNDALLLNRVTTSLASFLDLQWRNGALLGNEPEQAYYVKCDEELNDDASRNNGMLIAEVGYAKKKPAEFVIIRIVQKSQSE